MLENDFEKAAQVLRDAKRAIASTGAGISVESGIADFRSPGGIWEKYPPEEYATIDAFMTNPTKVWGFWKELGRDMSDVKPNPGHFALAQLEEAGHLAAVITQNVDNLHQVAGSRNVIEYHGNAHRLVCLGCHKKRPFVMSEIVEIPPRCNCDGLLKPDVIMFGEMIPKYAMFESEALAQKADVVIIVGTSAQVFPAAGLPYTAKQRGAFIIEVNKEETEFTRSITDVFLKGLSGETLPRLVEAVLV